MANDARSVSVAVATYCMPVMMTIAFEEGGAKLLVWQTQHGYERTEAVTAGVTATTLPIPFCTHLPLYDMKGGIAASMASCVPAGQPRAAPTSVAAMTLLTHARTASGSFFAPARRCTARVRVCSFASGVSSLPSTTCIRRSPERHARLPGYAPPSHYSARYRYADYKDAARLTVNVRRHWHTLLLLAIANG